MAYGKATASSDLCRNILQSESNNTRAFTVEVYKGRSMFIRCENDKKYLDIQKMYRAWTSGRGQQVLGYSVTMVRCSSWKGF